MNKIFVSNAKDDKSNSKKLVSKLEADGIKCYTLPRDKSQGNTEKLISDSNIFILILSKHTQNSKEVTEQIKIAYDNNCHIIPFKTSAINDSMSLQYFLHSLEWVDAHEDGFNEAYEVLLEIIEEITGKKTKTPKTKSLNDSFELKKSYLFGIIAILFAIIIYQFTLNNSEKEQKIYSNSKVIKQNEAPNPADFTNKDLNEKEKLIVGSWKMADYEDSRIMSPEEKKITEQNIEAMKKSVLLKYNSDRTFERIGFAPQPQKGYWEYDAKKRKIFLTPENINKKEEVNILNLTDKEMTIVVTEYIQNQQGKPETVTTKITFVKQ